MPRSPRASASPVRAQTITARSIAALVVAAALSVALAACAPEDRVMSDPTTATSTATATPAPTATPTAPPTPTTPPASDAPTTPPDSRASVDVVIVSWGGGAGEVRASGIVPGLVEPGGTCTLTATGADGGYFTGSRDAEPATDSTDCGVVSIPVGPGDWSLTLTYDSPTATGQSTPQTATAS